jgi:hypothetical protein
MFPHNYEARGTPNMEKQEYGKMLSKPFKPPKTYQSGKIVRK